MRIVFLLPVFLIGLAPFAFAETEYGINYDKETTVNPFGVKTVKHTLLSYERTYDGSAYKDYIFTDVGNALEIKTANSKIHLDKSTCGFSFYNSNGVFLFNDSIIAFNSIVDQYTWNAITQINNASCEAYYDLGENALVAKKYASGIGYMEYKYIFYKGTWKTQLEATNLTSLTNRVFAFDQTINLNRDTINFGGVTRNLDSFNGKTFDRIFIENNKVKIINFLNDFYFDLDLGIDYLDSITVTDTGVNSSKLTFHYMKNNQVLLPNETFIIDPTFTGSPSSSGKNFNVASAAATCNTAYDGSDVALEIIKYDSGTVARCHMPYFNFNVTDIPDTLTNISSMYLEHDSTDNNAVGTANEHGVIIKLPNTGTSSATTWGETIAQTFKYSADNSVTLNGGVVNQQVPFTATAISNVIAQIQAGNNTISLAITPTSLTRVAGVGNGLGTITFSNVELVIVYNDSSPINIAFPEFDVDIVGDTARISGLANITSGLNPETNQTGITILVDDSAINTNTTSTNGTVPFTVNFGPFWYRMTTDSTFNFTAQVFAQNTTNTVSNSTSLLTTREYDPSYSPAVDNPSIQGNVNATIERFDDQDGILLKVNRIGVLTGDTWQIECIAQTNSQAASTKNETLTWPGTWQNETNTGYFNTTYTGFANSHAYITCFNEDELFSMTSFTNSSLALLGIELFDDSYGSMLGVPVGVFFLVMTAGMANKRTAPTFIIVITGIAGTMATIGFFSFDPLVWGLALVTAMLGIFVNQKIF